MDEDFEYAEGDWDDLEQHELNELANDRECESEDGNEDESEDSNETDDVIDTYSRAQAIEDGVLVELDQELAGQAGFRFHVAATRFVFDSCIAMTPAAERACNDVTGRAWDVLWMAGMAVRRAERGASDVPFSVLCVTEKASPTKFALRCVIGPGDDETPVITIMGAEED